MIVTSYGYGFLGQKAFSPSLQMQIEEIILVTRTIAINFVCLDNGVVAV